MVSRTDGDAVQEGSDAAENLDALLAEAGALDNAPAEGAQAVQAAQEKQAAQFVESASAELLTALQMARGMLLPMLPERKAQRLALVWHDSVLKGSAEAGATIMQMHGITLGGALSRYGPYLMLAGVLAGPVIETKRIMQEPEPQPVQEVKPHGGE